VFEIYSSSYTITHSLGTGDDGLLLLLATEVLQIKYAASVPAF
jgi:hypothetical protein